MAMTDPAVVRDPLYGDLALNWKWMLGLGVLIALLGLVGLGMTYALTLVSVMWFGVLALIGGIAQVIDSFKYKGWRAFFAHILLGLLYVAAGVVMVALPVQSALWLTLLLGAAFVVTGVLRLVMAFQLKGAAAIALGVTGAISVFLGVLIYATVDLPTAEQVATAEGMVAWFTSWGWVIGLFVAIELLSHGLSLVALAFVAKSRGVSLPPRTTGLTT